MHTARHAHTTGSSAVASWYVPGRADGFGDRLLMFDNTSTPSLELLRLRRELCATPGFEDALRDRVRQLDRFRHDAFAPVRALQYLDDRTLTLVSVHAAGQRLSELFDQHPPQGLNPAIVSWILRELVPALADLQSQGDGVAHGALTTDRIVLTPDGRLQIVEHVLGSALATLARSPSALWREFSLFALPDGGGLAGTDPRGDVAQLAGVALSMLLARPVTLFDLQHRVPALLDEFSELTTAPSAHHVSPLRLWLERALHVGGAGYTSASDAQYDVRQLPSQSDIATVVVSKAGVTPEPVQPAESAAESEGSAARSVLYGFPGQNEPATASDAGPEPLLQGFPSELLDAADQQAPDRRRAGDALGASGSATGAAARPRPARTAPVTPAPATTPPVTTPYARPPAAGPSARRPMSARTAQPTTPPSMTTPRVAASSAAGPAVRSTAPAPVAERGRGGLVVVMAAAILAQSAVIGFLVTRPVPSAPTSILIESSQPGDAVVVNGQAAGATPFELKVGSDLKSLRVIPAPSTGATPSAGRRNPASPSASKSQPAVPAAARPRDGSVRLMSPNDPRLSEDSELSGTAAQGLMSINALPWANCQLGARLLGETPLANLKVPLGEHEVTCRHPQLGERRRTVIVRAGEVARVSLRFDQ